MMANHIIRDQEKNNKKQPHRNLYDVYAIFCDRDHAKIDNLLKVLNHVGLRVHCKDYEIPGQQIFKAVQNGITASKCSLLFVSTNFERDPICVFSADMALLQYIRSDRKHRIITVCLDHTKIPYLGIFKEIPIKNFSRGIIPDIILDERLLCIIYKAIKGPQEKLIKQNWKRYHRSFNQRKKIKLLKAAKKSKFSYFRFIFAPRKKMINLGYIIRERFFNSLLWRKLIKLVNNQKVFPIIQHSGPQNIEFHHLRQYINNPHHSSSDFEIQQSFCKYCNLMVLTSELKQHENECWRPDKCESCGRLISRAQKQQHENGCILEECFNCYDFHPPSYDCSEPNSLITGIFEDLETREDFSSLSSQVTPKYTGQPEVKKTMDKLMKVVGRSLSKKKKKDTEDQFREINELVLQLLVKLKDHQIIDQHNIDSIHETIKCNPVSMLYSAKSLIYFKNFVYAVELHCSNISLFKDQPLVAEIMSEVEPQQQKRKFLHRFRRRSPQNNNTDSEQFFPSLLQNLFKL